jgi:hypothetical protein
MDDPDIDTPSPTATAAPATASLNAPGEDVKPSMWVIFFIN